MLEHLKKLYFQREKIPKENEMSSGQVCEKNKLLVLLWGKNGYNGFSTQF